MSTMNISLPESLKDLVDKQVTERGYRTSREYVRALIRADQERLSLRKLLLEGARSPTAATIDETCFRGLRKRARQAAK
jgi:antitoxin ParD1/3/4